MLLAYLLFFLTPFPSDIYLLLLRYDAVVVPQLFAITSSFLAADQKIPQGGAF